MGRLDHLQPACFLQSVLDASALARHQRMNTHELAPTIIGSFLKSSLNKSANPAFSLNESAQRGDQAILQSQYLIEQFGSR